METSRDGLNELLDTASFINLALVPWFLWQVTKGQ